MASFGVVFALGAGSAAAQLLAVDSDFTIAVDDVTEGDAVRITVTLAASVNANVNTATAVTVSVSVINRQDGPNTEAEDGDRTFNGADTFMLTFPANETANATDKMTKSGSVLLQTLHDVDAENEDLTVDATLSGGGINPDAEEMNIVIEDDEDQTYVLALSPASRRPREGDMVTVSLEAEPAHVQGSELLTLHLDQTPPFAIAIEQGGAPVQGSSVEIGGEQDNSTATITITTNGNDKNRADDTIALSAYSGMAGDSRGRGQAGNHAGGHRQAARGHRDGHRARRGGRPGRPAARYGRVDHGRPDHRPRRSPSSTRTGRPRRPARRSWFR